MAGNKASFREYFTKKGVPKDPYVLEIVRLVNHVRVLLRELKKLVKLFILKS